MPNGTRPYRYQDQLRADLRSGRPIPYRRLPGSRRYYNPRTGNEVTEDYVVRHYRPALDQYQREIAKQDIRLRTRRSNAARRSMKATYLLKKQADMVALGVPQQTLDQLWKAYRAEFNELFLEMKRIQIQVSRTRMGSPQRETLTSGDGRYADLLVELGRREPEENFPVGMSPTPTGGYINTVVIPYYQQQIGG